ncbi:hypothetical protein [Lacinutrix sp.]|uniref:hypothetical protein n=1 Tax=Lacinutrix sp. TaxID=1937692 RepID=UPI0025C0A042|nr:hypothetical protein [Lacinutrix sp.]
MAPSVLVLVDDSIDVSFLFDASEEEEEEKGKEKNKELEVFVIDTTLEAERFFASESQDNLEYTFKNYPKPHLNLLFPPPEFI